MGIVEDAIAERDRRSLVAAAIAERDRRAAAPEPEQALFAPGLDPDMGPGNLSVGPDRVPNQGVFAPRTNPPIEIPIEPRRSPIQAVEGEELTSQTGILPPAELPKAKRPGPAREFQGVADEFIRALGRGSLNVGSGLLSTFADVAVDSLFDAEGIELLAEAARDAAQKPKFQPATDAGVKGFIANAVGDALPFMAATIAATIIGGPTAGFGVAYSVEGKNAYFDALEGGATQSQAEMEGMVVGSINAAIEGLQVGKVMKFARAGKGSAKAVAAAGKKNAIKALVKQGKNITKESVKLSITEGLQEAAQEIVSVLAPATTGRELQEEGKAKRILQSGLGGAVAGPILGGAGHISQAAAGRFGIEVDEEGTPIEPEGVRFESEVAGTLAGLQARFEAEQAAKKKIADNVPLDPADREQFPELARQEDQIARIRATDIRTLPEAPREGVAPAPERPQIEKAAPGVQPEGVKGAKSQEAVGKRTLFHGGPVKKGELPTVAKADLTDIRGVFFTEDKETAKFFGEREGRKGIVQEFEVDLKNPATGKVADQIETKLRAEGIKEPQIFDAVTDELLERGFDSVIRESGVGNEIIVLKDEAITQPPTEARPPAKPKTVEAKATKPPAVPKKPVTAPKKAAPITPETKQSQPKVGPGESVTKTVETAVEDALATDITDPAFPTSTKHASTKEIRERLGIGQVNSKERRSDEEAQKLAVERKIPEKANRIAEEINAEPRALSDVENAGLTIKQAELEIEHEQLSNLIGKATDDADIKTLGAEIGRVRAEFDALESALETSGTEAGRALRARRVGIGRDFKLISILNQAKAAAGKKLTAAKEKVFEQLTNKLAKIVKQVETLRVEVAELKAARTVKRGARRFTAMNKQQRQTSRQGLSAKVVQLLQQGCNN